MKAQEFTIPKFRNLDLILGLTLNDDHPSKAAA
jgi:hypothetical protein